MSIFFDPREPFPMPAPAEGRAIAGLSGLSFLGNAASGLAGSALAGRGMPKQGLAVGLGMLPSPTPRRSVADALYGHSTKRKAYFAFRFRDIMRVNNIREAWKIQHPDSTAMRSFYDRSIWGTSRSTNADTLKKLMREGVEFSSAVCVLIGSETWHSRWVRYEIARSVIDGRGLLGVHINGLNHIDRQTPDLHGYNPLECLGVVLSTNGKYYLYENVPHVSDVASGQLTWKWKQYEDFTDPVSLPRYMAAPSPGFVMPLSRYTRAYDYAAMGGHRNIGAWIDQAAVDAGR